VLAEEDHDRAGLDDVAALVVPGIVLHVGERAQREEYDVVVALELGPLAGGGGVLERQRVEVEDLAELVELRLGGVVEPQPDEAAAVAGGLDRGREVGRVLADAVAVQAPVDGGVQQAGLGGRRRAGRRVVGDDLHDAHSSAVMESPGVLNGGVSAFTRALAIDEARHGVRVNAVLPGNVLTPMRVASVAAAPDPQALNDTIESWQWTGRSATIDEIGQVCLFLASDAASFVTGIELNATGGAELGYGIKLPSKIT